MQQRQLGSNGPTVSAEGLGCMGMSFAYSGQDDAESTATLLEALDSGVNFLDTADMYGPWTNERLIGKAIAGRRDDIVLATKFGNEIDGDGKPTGEVNGRPEYLRAAIDGSLQRLGTDRIDLYYQHRVDPDTPIEETWGALAELVADGKVRHLGISEASAETIRKAHAVHPVAAVQTEYSLFTRDVEHNGVLDATRELGIGFVAYSPLGRGFLTGAIRSVADLPEDDRRRSWPRFAEENIRANLAVVDKVREVAERSGTSATALALAWVLAKGEDIVPIPGTKRRKYLRENLSALDVTLAAADLADIEAAAPAGVAAGERYPAAQMDRVNI